MHIDVKKVRKLFEKLSKTPHSDFFWRECSKYLHERLSMMKVTVDCLADMGCGKGDDLVLLKAHFPQALAIGLDSSFIPIKCADKPFNQNVGYVCGDAENSPFRKETFDLIWSNMMLHWAEDIGGVLAEWYQLLKPQGLLLFSCLGYYSLHRLFHVFGQINGYDHIMAFPDFQQLGNAMVETGFTAPVVEHEWINVTYQDINKLLQDIRIFGDNPLVGARQGLMGQRAFANLLEALEGLRGDDGMITLQFEVIFAHAFKTIASKKRFNIEREKSVAFYAKI